MKTDLEQFEELKKIYEEEVKPNIINREYADAGIWMNRLIQLMTLEDNCRKIMQTYHNGPQLVTAARLLEDNLFKEEVSDSVIEKNVKEFESWMAQLCLAIKSENKF